MKSLMTIEPKLAKNWMELAYSTTTGWSPTQITPPTSPRNISHYQYAELNSMLSKCVEVNSKITHLLRNSKQW